MNYRDEITGRPALAKEDLEHGAYYKGRCRNATIARWHEEEQRFYHWRVKFDRVFIETIRHPADEPRFDVFWPAERLAQVKFEIPFVPWEDRYEVEFTGNVDDLGEFAEEMWRKWPGPSKG